MVDPACNKYKMGLIFFIFQHRRASFFTRTQGQPKLLIKYLIKRYQLPKTKKSYFLFQENPLVKRVVAIFDQDSSGEIDFKVENIFIIL